MRRHISATVLSYRQPEKLARCIAALDASHGIAPDVFVWRNDEMNRWCSGGFNAGLRRWLTDDYDLQSSMPTPYHVLVTQDCYLAPDALSNLAIFMDAHERCGIAGVKQIADDGDTIIHGGCREAYPAGRHYAGSKAKGDLSITRRMPWVNGSVMIIRRECIQDIGLFDERMKLIGIESDLCYRARAAGWECWYCAEAECLHEHGGVSSTPPDDATLAIFREDMTRWQEKWIGSKLYADLATEFQFQ